MIIVIIMPKPTKSGHVHGPGCKHDHVEQGPDARRDFQKKYLQFQMARQYAAAMADEKANVDAKVAELAMTISSLEGLQKTKSGEDMMSTLGSDVYVSSNINDVSTAVVGVGAGVYVRKPLAEAIATLKARRIEFVEIATQLNLQIVTLNEQLAKMEPEIQAMALQMEDSKT